ncbi:S8 family serine peptidase [Candidatus Poribacteria bacterium]
MRGKGQTVKVFAILTVLLVCMALVGPAMASNSKRVLVGFKKGSGYKNAESRGKFVKDRGGKVHHSFKSIDVVSAELSEKDIAKMKKRGEIAYVEDDIMMYAVAQETPWGVNRVNAPAAWGTSKGAGVDVAILDTGIDYDHPDLDGNLVGGVNFSGTAADGNTNASYWNDNYGHGTHCAGIVAAEDNATGVVGVAPDADLWAVKVLGDNGSGPVSDIIQGIEWCANNSIEVASMSFSGGYSASMDAACNAAYADGAGVLLVAAAGNYYGGLVASPANFGAVIAVSALDSNDQIARFSNIGQEIELTAPGVNINSTYVGGGYTSKSGTSMACPHVSGVAALVFASSGSSAEGVRQKMNDTAMDIGLSWSRQGNGLVDAANAVGGTTSPSPPVADFSGNPTSGVASLDVDFADESTGSVTSWSWTFGDGGTSNQRYPSHRYQNNGRYTVSLRVTGSSGEDTCTYTDYITVESPSPTVADFSGSPTSGAAPLTVAFADESTGSPTSWSWTFGDGGTSAQQYPSYTYQNAGDYTVSLTATGPGGTDSYTRTNYIYVTEPQPPVANFFGSPTSGVAPLTVGFSDLSTGSITSWSWNFGDGGTSSQQNPSHTYQNAGSHTVSLTVTGPSGLEDTYTRGSYIVVEQQEQLFLYVIDIDLRASYRGSKKWQATATVLIRDSNGNSVSGATVNGAWSGAYSRSASGTTSNGQVSLRTGWMRKRGSVTFTVNNVSKSGYEYTSGPESSVMIAYGQ